MHGHTNCNIGVSKAFHKHYHVWHHRHLYRRYDQHTVQDHMATGIGIIGMHKTKICNNIITMGSHTSLTCLLCSNQRVSSTIRATHLVVVCVVGVFMEHGFEPTFSAHTTVCSRAMSQGNTCELHRVGISTYAAKCGQHLCRYCSSC